MLSQFNEKQQRLYAASEALKIGFGGISKISRETGISRVTITAGINQLRLGVIQDGRSSSHYGRKHSRQGVISS